MTQKLDYCQYTLELPLQLDSKKHSDERVREESPIISDRFIRALFKTLRNYFVCLSIFSAGYIPPFAPDQRFFARTAICFSVVLAVVNTLYMVSYMEEDSTVQDQNLEEKSNAATEEKVTVDSVFAHFSNFLLCAALFLVGVKFLRDANLIVSGIGWLAASASIPFAVLNSLNVIQRIWTTVRPIRGQATGMSRGSTARLVILICYIGFVALILRFTVAIRLQCF